MPAAAETKKIPERDRSGIRDLSTGQEIKIVRLAPALRQISPFL